jgi:hypothetical protein
MLGQVRSLFEARAKRDAAKEAVRAAAEPTFTREEYESAYTESFEKGKAEAFQEAYANALEEASAAGAEAFAKGMKDGAKTETARIKTILTPPEAKDRVEQARYFFDTEIPAEQAVALLAKAPVSAPVAATSGLLAEMAAMQPPQIGRAGPAAGGPETKFEQGARAARAALGIPPDMMKY